MKFGSRPPWPGELNLGIFFGIILLLGLPVAFLIGDYFAAIYPGCPFRIITGIPCLTCGFTRSVLALRDGHFIRSLRMNPLLWVLTALIISWSVWSVVLRITKHHRPQITVSMDERKWVTGGILLLLLLNWGYLIWAGI